MKPRWTRQKALRAALLLGAPASLLIGAGGAFAQAAPSSNAPSSNAMVNLVRLLIAQGTISKEKGDELIEQATREAAEAVAAQSAASAATAQAAGTLPPPPPGTVRVPYVPETVRAQIRDELRADVIKQAREEGWASPDKAAPEWVRDFKLYGDLRVRSQSQLYSRFNSTDVFNFQSIVAGGPIDIGDPTIPIPLLNSTENRYNLMRLRLRLGMDVTVSPAIKAGIELATGNDASPLSTNSNLGGGLFKRNIYLNKAYVTVRPFDWWSITAGRMDNPFLSTDALFDPDLRFDGVAGELSKSSVLDIVDVKLRGGAFPLDFGDPNFPSTSNIKLATRQKWLFSAQIEGDYHFGKNKTLKLAAAYHDFANLQGRPSDPCALGPGVNMCNTDASAAFFVQKGNTLFNIRRIINSLGQQTNGPNLIGLTQPYHVLDLIAAWRMKAGENTEFTLVGDYLRNLGFRRSNACRYGIEFEPLNNNGPLPPNGLGNICDPDATKRVAYVAGNQGFQIMAGFGHPTPRAWGEWRVYAGYKYLESDATLDAFTDDDFHLGGTNAKGYIVGGVLGVARNTTLGARWLSTNQVSGEPLAIDVFQFDVNVSF